MVINDKLKGSYYRVPMTKLASRSNIVNQFDELIEYFESLNDLLSNIFNKVTESREYTIGLLQKMEVIIAHFKYILDNYENELEAHIAERLSTLINTFTASFNNIVENYDINLFNHSFVSDDAGSVSTKNLETNLEEWDRSISMNASELGIRWFGGKFSDKHVVSEINNIFHLVKVNTYDHGINEDVINSNPVLELFIKTPKGISWLVLGQNSALGHNLIVKYQSGELINNIKVMSEKYYTPKNYDINQFDLNLYIQTLLNSDDVDGSNVYIKVKTNISSNTESGRESYYISTSRDGSTNLDDYHDSRLILNAANKMMYKDNKDVQVLKQDETTISEIANQDNPIEVETEEITNPIIEKIDINDNINTENKSYYSEIKNKISSNDNIVMNNETYNPNGSVMNNMMDLINGRVSHHETLVNLNESFVNKFCSNDNEKYEESSKAKYFKGQQIEDLFDYRNVGKINLIAKNENMFECDGSVNNSHEVVNNDASYQGNVNDTSIVNHLYNNNLFNTINDSDKYTIKKFRVLHKDSEEYKINCIAKTSVLGTILGTSKGIYVLNKNTGFITPSVDITCIIEFNNVIIVGTKGSGIYYYNTTSKKFVNTNIIRGNISTFFKCQKPDTEEETLYAIKSDCSYSTNSTQGNYSLNNFYYCLYDPSNITQGWISEQDMDVRYLGDEGNAYRVSAIDIASGLTTHNETDDQKYKVIYNKMLKKYFILNKESGFVASTSTNKFLNFEKSAIYNEFGDNIIDIEYDNDIMYVAVNDPNKNISTVYKYDSSKFISMNAIDTVVKNDRNKTVKTVYLSSLSSIM